MNTLKLLVIHGPNLNLLGMREPEIYGSLTLRDIDLQLKQLGSELGAAVECYQSNAEGDIVSEIHSTREAKHGLILNAGAYTHTSVAIRDAIAAVAIPTVEVHLSNIYKREEFRHHSYIAPLAIGQISGFGVDSYLLGLRALIDYLHQQKS
ncbi:MAG: type II 3-dehydroquinate dehydratase [Synechococcaceae cyanobacterium RL_1_2]|nr:type II 3-dehydroquinate dehydratase [Synechococcaceae cyanobacterium RL_1_2]